MSAANSRCLGRLYELPCGARGERSIHLERLIAEGTEDRDSMKVFEERRKVEESVIGPTNTEASS